MSDAVATTPAAPAVEAPAPTTTNETPEAAPAAAAPEAAPPAAEAAKPEAEQPPAEAPKPPEPKAEPKEFIALKRERAKILQEKQALKSEKQQVEAAMREIVAPVKEVLEKFEDTPLGLLEFAAKATGKNVQEVFDALVVAASKHGDPPDPNDRVSKLEKQIEAERLAREKERQEAEARLAEQAEAKMRADLSQMIGTYLDQSGDEYPTIKSWGEYYETVGDGGRPVILRGEEARAKIHNDLMDLAEVWQDTEYRNQEPSITNVARALEAAYLELDEGRLTNRQLKNPKLSKHFAPPAPPAPAQPAPTPTNAAQPAQSEAAPAGDTTKQAPSPRHISASRAIVPAGSKVVRRSSMDDEQAWIEEQGKRVRFTSSTR